VTVLRWVNTVAADRKVGIAVASRKLRLPLMMRSVAQYERRGLPNPRPGSRTGQAAAHGVALFYQNRKHVLIRYAGR
jgi:hypothetical protein